MMRLPHTLRLLRIAVILLPALRSGRLSQALERLGPSFIKLGQTLSTRPDLIGARAAANLASLRDNLPPFPATVARRILQEEWGNPAETALASFDEMPVAAASIAQVHRATLKTGGTVAVKIVRPGVERQFARDIAFFYWAARRMTRFFPRWRRLKPLEVVKTLENSVAFELDMRYEAAATEELRNNTKEDAYLHIPAIEWPLVARRVLVTEWVNGTPIEDVEALRAAGHDPDTILARLAEHFFNQAFRDGFFHADLHPGNLRVDASGAVAMFDFGIMGRLSRRERIYMAEIFRGFLNEDFRRVAEMHFRAGYVPKTQSVEQFAQACMAIARPILGRPVQEISMANLLGQLFQVTETFQMETQPQLLLFQKTLVVVEGVGRMLNPQINMWELARTPIESWAKDHFGPRGRAKHAAQELLECLEALPALLEKIKSELTGKHHA